MLKDEIKDGAETDRQEGLRSNLECEEQVSPCDGAQCGAAPILEPTDVHEYLQDSHINSGAETQVPSPESADTPQEVTPDFPPAAGQLCKTLGPSNSVSVSKMEANRNETRMADHIPTREQGHLAILEFLHYTANSDPRRESITTYETSNALQDFHGQSRFLIPDCVSKVIGRSKLNLHRLPAFDLRLFRGFPKERLSELLDDPGLLRQTYMAKVPVKEIMESAVIRAREEYARLATTFKVEKGDDYN